MPAGVSPAAGAAASLAVRLLLVDALSSVYAAAAAAQDGNSSSTTVTAAAATVTAANTSSIALWPSTPAVDVDSPVAEAAELDNATSLVPLFILLAAFTLIVVGCVALCQRLRSRQKDRFAGEHHLCSWEQPKQSRGRVAAVTADCSKYKGRLTHASAEPAMGLTCSPPASVSPNPLRRAGGVGSVDRMPEKPGRATVTFADETAVAVRPRANYPAIAAQVGRAIPSSSSKAEAEDLGSTVPAAAFRPLEVKVPGSADHIIVVKQIQGSSVSGRQRLDVGLDGVVGTTASSLDAERRRFVDAMLTPDAPELRVALLENEELTIHSQDGHVFQVALIRASASSTSMDTAAAAENGLSSLPRQAGRQQQQRAAAAAVAARGRRRRTMSDGPSIRRRAARVHARVDAVAGADPQANCQETVAEVEQLLPAKAASLELPVGASHDADPAQCLTALVRPKSRLQLSLSESSSQDENECASLLTKEVSPCLEADTKLLGAFAASSAGEAVPEHSR